MKGIKKITFEEFEKVYIDCLSAFSQDRNPCYKAFEAARAIVNKKYGNPKYNSYQAFRSCLSRHRKARRSAVLLKQVSISITYVSKIID
jgi:hypothetical protein